MPKIIKLGQHIADLIAAGEVVSRPASVVKELIENSIDAGANIITVEIFSGGMKSIRVTDNGCGIDPEDVKTAFLRHATSKLRDAGGLDAIQTLGFRGEALAAVAAVSRIELLTRTPDADEGTRLFIEAGEPSNTSPAGTPPGTTIIVRDLFFNTPARLKFMKTDRAEGAAVSSAVLRCALSRPDISFRYIKDGRTEYHTPGDSKPDSCIYSLLGREFEAGLIPVSLSDENVTVTGYISTPQAARGNRSYQFFFINGRSIRSLLLQSAIELAYKNKLTPGRFPSCVFYIQVKVNSVDVNVHPAKTEVRFMSEKQVFDGVYYAATGALEALSIPDTTPSPLTGKAIHLSAGFEGNENKRISVPARHPDNRVSEPVFFRGINQNKLYDTSVRDTAMSYIGENSLSPAYTGASTAVLPAYRVIGQAFAAYIIVEKDDCVWFIDKHAAHERMQYNALAGGRYKPMSETLISPIICRIGCAQTQSLLDNIALLDSFGFAVDRFGEDSIAVRCIPEYIHQRDVESVLNDLCIQIRQGDITDPLNLDKMYKIIACKASIKAGSSTQMCELETLTEKVMSGELSHCPHGRPTAFKITKTELEKSFGRV